MKHYTRPALLIALALGTASPALALEWFASTVDANSAADHTNSAGITLDVGNSDTIGATGSTVTARVTAWSNTRQTTTVNETGVGTTTNSLTDKLESAYLSYWSGSGYGVANRDSTASTATTGDPREGSDPEHAVDNDGRYDSMLFSFSGATNGVVLSSIYNGWVSAGDSDFSVWAYTGGTSTSTDLTGKTYDNLGTGWSLIGHYNAGAAGSANINASGVSSSYWLIGAYTPVSGASCKDGTTGLDSTGCDLGDDYFKFKSLSGSIANCTNNPTAPGCGPGGNAVPEPATLGLLGLGLLGLFRIRARRAA